MKVAIVADTHIHSFQQFATGAGGTNSRVQISLDSLRQVFEHCLANDISHVIHLGDLFHARDYQRFGVFNATYDLLAAYQEKGLQMVLIPGNHDMIDKAGKELSIHSLQSVVLLVREITFFNDLNCLLIPYTADFELVESKLSEQPDNVGILGHLDISGAVAGSASYVLDIGMNASLFSRFQRVLFGHYHIRQPIGKNGYYVGSLTPVDFGEANQAGSFCTLDTDTWQVDWFTVQCPKFVVWKVGPLDCFPEEAFRQHVAGNYVRVVAEPSQLWEDRLLQCGAVAWDWRPERCQESTTTRIADIETMSMAATINQYVDKQTSKLDKERLKRDGHAYARIC